LPRFKERDRALSILICALEVSRIARFTVTARVITAATGISLRALNGRTGAHNWAPMRSSRLQGRGFCDRLKSLHFEVEAGDFCFGFVSLRNCIK